MTVRLHTILRREGPDGPIDRVMLDLPPGATVGAVLQAMGIADQEDAILLVVNSRIADAETPLREGDEVRLIPAISGGG